MTINPDHPDTEGLIEKLHERAAEHRGFFGSAKDYGLFDQAASALSYYLEREQGSSYASRAATGPLPRIASEAVLSAADYEEVLADQRRLVRELDVLLNGEAGAANQASLCDIVGQVRDGRLALVPREPTEAMRTAGALRDTHPSSAAYGSKFIAEDEAAEVYRAMIGAALGGCAS